MPWARRIDHHDGVVIRRFGNLVHRVADVFVELPAHQGSGVERRVADGPFGAVECEVKVSPYTQQADPERIVAVRRIRGPIRNEPKAGHIDCG